uniref:NSF attachment protein n=1 Tax=Helianthus annuus TaxID=4232 RepID=A0A251V2J9_HELAN
MAAADPEKLIAKADKLTKLTLTRWSADWKNATQYYEQAAYVLDKSSYKFKRLLLVSLTRMKSCITLGSYCF